MGDTLSTSSMDIGRAIGATSAGHYILAGSTESYGQGLKDIYVAKINGAGDTLWSTVVGGQGEDSGESIAIHSDDGAFISGYTESVGPTGTDIFVMRLDASGALLWSRTYGSGGTDRSFSVIATNDGGCAVAGVTGGASVVLKFDMLGVIQWVTTLAGSNPIAYALVQDPNGNYLVTGTYVTGVLLSKLDSLGNELWRRTINPGGAEDECQSIIATYDGGYALGGYTKSYGQGDWDMYVIKLDPSGAVEWGTTVGTSGEDYVESIVQDPDSGFTIAGSSGGMGCLVRLGSMGDSLLWSTGIGYAGQSTQLQGMLRTNGGGYACVGLTTHYASGSAKRLLFSLSSIHGVSCCSLPFIAMLASGFVESNELTNATVSQPPIPLAAMARAHGSERVIHCADAFVLPVELISFTGTAEGKRVRLSWSTASERDNDHFSVHRSSDMSSFQHLFDVAGSGSSQVATDYQAYDEAPTLGINYYRLSQYDLDGTIGYQRVIAVEFVGDEEFNVTVFPNPVVDELTVLVSGAIVGAAHSKEFKLEVNDAVGRPFIRTVFKGDRALVDTSALMSGTFEVRVLSCTGELCRVARMVKLRKR